MFGAQNSTPYKKNAAMATSVAKGESNAPTFSSVSSSFKRKRDQMEKEDRNSTVNHNCIARVAKHDSLAINDPDEILSTRLFSTGDVIVLKKQANTYCNLSFFPETQKTNDSRVVNIAWPQTEIEAMENVFDIGRGTSDSTDLVACSRDGTLILVHLTADGALQATEHKVLLNEENERVTAICHAGNVLVLGTSTEDLYLIRRHGKAISADRLQKSQNVFMGLFQTGAKLIGIVAPRDSRDCNVVKIISIPLSPLLISVSSRMTLWSEWSSPGQEKLVWEFKLKSLVRLDIQAFGAETTKLRIVDACLMQTEPGAKKAVLLVLSVSTDSQAAPEDGSMMPCTLWLHTLEIVTPHTGTFRASAGEAPVTVLHRVLIGDNVHFNMLSVVNADGSVSSELDNTLLKPKLLSFLPSWRVFVSWSALSRDGNYTLHSAQFDMLNQPVLSPANIAAEDRLNAVRADNAVDTEIDANYVVDTAGVTGLDGVGALLTDGSVILVSPPLPHRLPEDFPVGSTVKGKISDSVVVRRPAVDSTTLLLSISLGENIDASALSQLRDVFSVLPTSELLAAVREVSRKVLNRPPTGQYWGTSSSRKGLTGQALTRYQMVHRLVEEKLECHKRLLEAVSNAGVDAHDGLHEFILTEHQQLLLCAGLSSAVQESQQRLSNSSAPITVNTHSSPVKSFLTSGLLPEQKAGNVIGDSNSAAQQFSDQVHKESLRVLARGMDLAVRRDRGLNIEEIESQGLSVVDQFYSEASLISDGILAIAAALDEAQNDLIARGVLFHAAYGIASIVLSAVNFAKQGEGASDYSSSIFCHAKTRQAFMQIIALLQTGLHNLEDIPLGFAINREGRRLKELCSVLLLSYVVDATHAVDNNSTMHVGVVGTGEGGEHMSAEWKTEYHAAKTACVTLLLTLRHAHAAFAISEEFLFFSGLMEAVELDRQTLYPLLQTAVRTKGDVVGTDDVPLATACFLWLEEFRRPAEILKLGTLSKPLLDFFLESRPHLSWMNHIRSHRYAEATHSAVAHARHVPTTGKAQALLSLAKLTSIVASSEGGAPKAKSLQFLDRAKDATPSNLSARIANAATAQKVAQKHQQESETDMGCTMAELRSNLAVLKAQELLQDVCSSEFKDPSLRLNVETLVGLIVRIVESQQDSTQSTLKFDRPLDEVDIVRLFGVGVSLLSMELDVIDSLDSGGGPEEVRVAHLAKVEEMLIALWGAVVKVQTDAWLQLSAVPDLSAVEENLIRNHTVLYSALLATLSEVADRNLHKTILPHHYEERFHAVVARSGVDRLAFNSDGEVVEIGNDKPRNERIVFVIRVCVDMALSAAQAVQDGEYGK